MPKITRIVMATIVLAVALLTQPAAASGFNVYGYYDRWQPSLDPVYVCWAAPPPQGTNGSISATYWVGIKMMDAQAYNLTFSTYGSTTYIGACQYSIMANHRTYKLHWQRNIMDVLLPGPPPGSTLIDVRDNNGFIWQASTFIDPGVDWYYLTGKQNCIAWNCRPDLFTAAEHETGHTMGLDHRHWRGDVPSEHPWTWCHGGFDNEQVLLACRHVDDNGRYMGRDVMYQAAADGYRRWLTADDIAGINYWYQ